MKNKNPQFQKIIDFFILKALALFLIFYLVSPLGVQAQNAPSMKKVSLKMLIKEKNTEPTSILFGEKRENLGFLSSSEEEFVGVGTMGEILEGPSSFAVDESGHLFFLDSVNVEVKEFDSEGKLLNQFKLPVVNPKREYRYTDIRVDSSGLIYLLDSENNFIVPLDGKTGKALLERVVTIPTENQQSPILLETFGINKGGNFLTIDLQSNNLLEISRNQKNDKGFNLTQVLAPNLPFQTSLLPDSANRLLGFQANQDNPEMIEFFAFDPLKGAKGVEKLFTTKPLENIAFVEILGSDSKGMWVGIFTGGEERTLFKELRHYSLKGQLNQTLQINLEEISWAMNHKYHYSNGTLFLLENPRKSLKLNIHRVKS